MGNSNSFLSYTCFYTLKIVRAGPYLRAPPSIEKFVSKICRAKRPKIPNQDMKFWVKVKMMIYMKLDFTRRIYIMREFALNKILFWSLTENYGSSSNNTNSISMILKLVQSISILRCSTSIFVSFHKYPMSRCYFQVNFSQSL